MTRLIPTDFRLVRSLVITLIVAFLISSSPLRRVQAAAGDLDPTFGNGGKVSTDFFGFSEEAFNVVIQGDGKIIAVGNVYNPSTAYDFGLARYNVDGSLDQAFGSGGKVTTDFGSSDFAHGVAIQSDGKIVVTGSNGFVFELARYRVDGSLDQTFGSGGKVRQTFSTLALTLIKSPFRRTGKLWSQEMLASRVSDRCLSSCVTIPTAALIPRLDPAAG